MLTHLAELTLTLAIRSYTVIQRATMTGNRKMAQRIGISMILHFDRFDSEMHQAIPLGRVATWTCKGYNKQHICMALVRKNP